jgi:hypothetical protein
MKRKLTCGLLIVAIAMYVFGNTTISSAAETKPPDPMGIISIK